MQEMHTALPAFLIHPGFKLSYSILVQRFLPVGMIIIPAETREYTENRRLRKLKADHIHDTFLLSLLFTTLFTNTECRVLHQY